MKTRPASFRVILGAALFFTASLALRAGEEKKPAAGEPSAPAEPKAAPAEPKPAPSTAAKPTQEELEAKFKATLTNATLNGRWSSVKDGQLGPEKEEKYTILGVNKLLGDTWLIRARIQYGKNDYTLPVPVQVKWAGDTPVIVVDKFGIPGGASYSARVLFYEKTYAGTWTGGEHGGLLNGVITNEKE